jgi:hypothetical protein
LLITRRAFTAVSSLAALAGFSEFGLIADARALLPTS